MQAVLEMQRNNRVHLTVQPKYQRRVAVDLCRLDVASIRPSPLASSRATLSAPTIGRRTACLTPPPSPRNTTSGARMSSRPCRSPVSTARRNAVDRVSRLGRRHDTARPTSRGDVVPRPVRDLAHRSRALVDGLGDLVVAEAEHLAQHEHCALGRRERLQHQQHRHRDALGQFDVLGDVGRGQQRLGQPRTDVGLLAPAERPQPRDRLASGDPHEVRALIPHRLEIDARPPQPRLLQHVLRIGGRAEHLVGDREQQVAMGDECLGGIVRTPAGASGAVSVDRLLARSYLAPCFAFDRPHTGRRTQPRCDTP